MIPFEKSFKILRFIFKRTGKLHESVEARLQRPTKTGGEMQHRQKQRCSLEGKNAVEWRSKSAVSSSFLGANAGVGVSRLRKTLEAVRHT